MQLPMWRIITAAIAIEALTVAVLVIVVAVFGPSNVDASRGYAERVGYWLGPAAGFVLCVAGGWLAARSLDSHHVITGLALGAAVAVIDVAILVASGAAFQFIFVASNAGRLIAGIIGGWLAARSRGGAV